MYPNGWETYEKLNSYASHQEDTRFGECVCHIQKHGTWECELAQLFAKLSISIKTEHLHNLYFCKILLLSYTHQKWAHAYITGHIRECSKQPYS